MPWGVSVPPQPGARFQPPFCRPERILVACPSHGSELHPKGTVLDVLPRVSPGQVRGRDRVKSTSHGNSTMCTAVPDILSRKEAGRYKGSEEGFYACKLMQDWDIQSQEVSEKLV